MINFRLKQAGYKNEMPLFTDDAIKLIYDHTQGYPRRIAMLCHDALEAIVMKDRSFVDAEIISELIFHGAQV
jgi:general secretion pathway protein A